MPENGLGIRAAALVSVALLASMFVCYVTARAASGTANHTTILTTAAQTSAETDRAGRHRVLPQITAALRNHDFFKARQIIETLPNARTRDQFSNVIKSAEHNKRFRTMTSAVTAARFAEGRSAAAAAWDEPVRGEIMQVIAFAEARHALTRGDVRTAAALTKSLRPGLKRTLLLTAIAASLQSAEDRASSLAHLQLALADVNDVAEHHRRQLLVMIAAVLLRMDIEKGLDVLDRALHERVARKAATYPDAIGIAGTQFYETIRAGGSRGAFSLVVPGVRGDLQELLLAYHGQIRCNHGTGEIRPSRTAQKVKPHRITEL